jgi:methyl-accepting chemotaxis protein
MKKLHEIVVVGAMTLLVLLVCTAISVTFRPAVGLAAKAIYQWDLSLDDIYEAYQSIVTDLNTLKNAIDNTGTTTTKLNSTISLANETSADLTTDATALATLVNETSADLETDSAALSLLANETSSDLTTDATNLATLANDITAKFGVMKNSVDDLVGQWRNAYNLGNVPTDITNIPTSIGANIVNVSARTAPAVNGTDRTAPVVTPTSRTASTVDAATISNTPGTLGTTTP